MKTRKVKITLTSKVVGSYEARSYPHDDYNKNGKIELYKVPVHQIVVSGTDKAGNPKKFIHKAPRFMPFWNDPARPVSDYTTTGWANSGLADRQTYIVREFIRSYRVRNRYSPGVGAIVMIGTFYIHAGPGKDSDVGFGSAGCVEIIGNYDTFKANIASLSGSSKAPDDAITQLVVDGNLIVDIQAATAPDIKSLFSREVIPRGK